MSHPLRCAALVLCFTTASPLLAADAKGCKDHPLFTRLPGYHIERCEKKFDAALIKLDEDPDAARNLRPEGDLWLIQYTYDEAAGTPPGFLQIKRNYQNAAKAQGASVLAEHPRYTALRFERSGGTVYAGIEAFNEGRNIELAILEQKAMTQEMSANLLWQGLQKDGFVTLYLEFDTNKAEIKPAWAGQIRQMAEMLRAQPKLAVSIEGHTDNQGSAAANKGLSLQRAEAVLRAIAANGIAAERLSAVGWGQEKPLADNRSEAGRAKNRRVEIVRRAP